MKWGALLKSRREIYVASDSSDGFDSLLKTQRLTRGSPQTAGGVAKQEGRLKLDSVFVAVRHAAPTRMWNDHGVGERAQSVTDDGHLHCIARRQVPQDTCEGGASSGHSHCMFVLDSMVFNLCILSSFLSLFAFLLQSQIQGNLSRNIKQTLEQHVVLVPV